MRLYAHTRTGYGCNGFAILLSRRPTWSPPMAEGHGTRARNTRKHDNIYTPTQRDGPKRPKKGKVPVMRRLYAGVMFTGFSDTAHTLTHADLQFKCVFKRMRFAPTGSPINLWRIRSPRRRRRHHPPSRAQSQPTPVRPVIRRQTPGPD